jgi:hypothetical protein
MSCVPGKIHLSQQELNELLEVRGGTLYWRKNPGTRPMAGTPAGGMSPSLYVQVIIQGKMYKAHRLVYKMFFGETSNQIVHRDGKRWNNDPTNLKEKVKEKTSLK